MIANITDSRLKKEEVSYLVISYNIVKKKRKMAQFLGKLTTLNYLSMDKPNDILFSYF